MKYVCLFLKSLVYSLSPMPGLKFQNQQNTCRTRELFCVPTQQREHQQFKLFPVSLQCSSEITLENPPDKWKYSLVLQPFKCLETFYISFILSCFFWRKTTQLALRGLKWRSNFNQNNPKMFFQINEIKALNIYTYILLW